MSCCPGVAQSCHLKSLMPARSRASHHAFVDTLERVYDLLSRRAKNARCTNCRLVLSSRSQFFHSRLFLSSPAKLRSTIQRLGMTLKVCSSLRAQSAPSVRRQATVSHRDHVAHPLPATVVKPERSGHGRRTARAPAVPPLQAWIVQPACPMRPASCAFIFDPLRYRPKGEMAYPITLP